MKELVEEENGFIQIFESGCFGKDIDPANVWSFQVIKDYWTKDENGKDVRHIQEAIAIGFFK